MSQAEPGLDIVEVKRIYPFKVLYERCNFCLFCFLLDAIFKEATTKFIVSLFLRPSCQ